jgi:hypothetical protein
MIVIEFSPDAPPFRVLENIGTCSIQVEGFIAEVGRYHEAAPTDRMKIRVTRGIQVDGICGSLGGKKSNPNTRRQP